MDGFPSGQRGQTVNLLQIASVVRIHLHPFLNNNFITRGGAVWKLVGLITRRSQVQILSPLFNAQIAQLVEQRTENPRVTGSIPVLGIFLSICLLLNYGPLAQVVEHLTFNQVVWGSNPQWLIKKIKRWEWGFEPLLISPVAH